MVRLSIGEKAFVGWMRGLLRYLSALCWVRDLAKRPDGIGISVDWHNVVETILVSNTLFMKSFACLDQTR